jgi:pyridoxamine 5'-phosphate oxidase
MSVLYMSAPAQDPAGLRTEYKRETLDERAVDRDPFAQFARWFDEAVAARLPEPNAMTLATVGPDGRPSARIVLLKGVDPRGLAFFTNYDSRKARELPDGAHAALLFYWHELERQVRIEGRVERIGAAESDTYFASRPRASRIGAWASPQSRVIADRAWLEQRFAEAQARFPGDDVPRPPHWGGYRVVPESFEFWQGRASRLHDRIAYRRASGDWTVVRLAP